MRARVSLGAVLAGLTAAVAAISFAISFHGLEGYGRHVMMLGGWSPLVPAGIDLAALVALVATHMRRGDGLGRRVYAWAVFATTAALSVAGNISDGLARGLPTAGLVGMGAAPVVFVLVSHLAITTRAPAPVAVSSSNLDEVLAAAGNASAKLAEVTGAAPDVAPALAPATGERQDNASDAPETITPAPETITTPIGTEIGRAGEAPEMITDLAGRARAAYTASIAAGAPLTGAQLGERYLRSESWGRARIAETRKKAPIGRPVNGARPQITVRQLT